jgi:hypothetical protein
VRFSVRRTLIGLAIAGVIGAAAFPFAIYYLGLALAPPRPVAAHDALPSPLAEAIWARAAGGHAAGFTPITPFTIGQFAACLAIEDFWDTTAGDARRAEACRHHLPGIEGAEYFSNVHMRDAHYPPSLRTGLSRLSTTIWVTHAWSKAEFLSTLAERAEFSFGIRGVQAAARVLLDRSVTELDVSRAALIASLIGNRNVNPWCDPATAANLRRRVLERMRDDRVIDEAAYQSANTSELGLTTAPAAYPSCGS